MLQLRGLLQTTIFQNHDILLSFFIPIRINYNAKNEKFLILKSSKKKTGIYFWTHLVSNRIYIDLVRNLYMIFILLY